MILLNTVASRFPIVPDSLADRIHFCSSIALNDTELILLATALRGVACALSEDKSAPKTAPCTMIFAGSDDVTLTFSKSPDQYGSQSNLIILPIHRWRERNFTQHQYLVCILEELCHFFWAEHDENLVCSLVLRAARHILPDVRPEDLYNVNNLPDVIWD